MTKRYLLAALLGACVFGHAHAGSDTPVYHPAIKFPTGGYGAALADAANSDSSTAMYCAFDAPDGSSSPQCGLNAIKHRGVGPFSDSNYLKLDPLGTGADILDFATPNWSACFIFKANTAPANSRIYTNGASGSAGATLRLDSANSKFGFAIYNGASTKEIYSATSSLVLGTVNTICVGVKDRNLFLKLNGAATVTDSASFDYTPATAIAAYLGRLNIINYSFDGLIYEAQFAPVEPTDALFTTQTAAAMSCRNAGKCLPDMTGEVVHLLGDDYLVGGSWNGNPDRTTRQAWGSFKDTEYLTYGASASDIMDLSNMTACFIYGTPAFRSPGNQVLLVNGNTTTAGWSAWTNSSGVFGAGFSGKTLSIAGATSAMDATNIGCIGRSGDNVYGKINGRTTVSDTKAHVSGDSVIPRIGRYSSANGWSFEGMIHEVWVSSTPWAEANVAAIETAVQASTARKALEATARADGNTVMYINAEDWSGTTVKSEINTGAVDWVTSGNLGSRRLRYSWPHHTFTLTGQVPTSEWRYNWPPLTWTPVGTVAKVTRSPLYPQGFEQEHVGLGGWSSANYLQAGTGSDVLDTTGDFSCFAIFYKGAGTGLNEYLVANGVDNVDGWVARINVSLGALRFLTNTSGSQTGISTTNSVVASQTNVAAWGRAGTTGYAQLNGGALATGGSHKTTSGTTSALRLGLYSEVGSNQRLSGSIYEVLCTSTSPSATFFSQKITEALSCTAPGACFSDDANVLMHCTADTDWSSATLRCATNKGNDPWTTNGTLTATSARYAWPEGVTKADREGAGPFLEATNYFTIPTASLFDIGTTGDLSVEMVTRLPTSNSVNQGVLGNKASAGANVQGLDVYVSSGNNAWCRVADGVANIYASTSVSAGLGSVEHIACIFDRDAGNITPTVVANGVAASGAATAIGNASSAAVMKLGYEAYDASENGYQGSIYELWVTKRAETTAEAQAHAAKALAKLSPNKEAITWTTATPPTCLIDNRTYQPAPNTPCLSNGRTNYRGTAANVAQYSEQIDNAIWEDYHNPYTYMTFDTAEKTEWMCSATATCSSLHGAAAFEIKDYSGSGDWTYTGSGGGTCTKTGTSGSLPRMSYPAGWAGTQGKKAIFDGAADRYGCGDILDPPGDFTLACIAYPDSVAADTPRILSKDDPAGGSGHGWYLRRNAAVPELILYKTGGSAMITPTGSMAMVAGAPNYIVCSYDYVTDGTSIMGCNTNGTDGGNKTDAAGPVNNVTDAFTIGSDGTAGPVEYYAGHLGICTVWTGWAATATDRTYMATSMAGVYGGTSNTAGTALTVTRSTTRYAADPNGILHVCTPNLPCYGCEGATCGLLVDPATTNYATYSETLSNAAWADTHGGATDPGSTTIADDSATSPANTLTADTVTVPACPDADDYSARCQDFTATAAKWTGSLYGKTAAGTANTYLYLWDKGATYYKTECSWTTAWSRCTVSATSNLTAATWALCFGNDRRDATQSDAGGDEYYAWGAQLEKPIGTNVIATNYFPSLTTAETRAADVVSYSNPFYNVNPSTWYVSATGQSKYAWNTAEIGALLGGFGTASSANSMKGYVSLGNHDVLIYDAAAGYKTYTFAHGLTTSSSHKITYCHTSAAGSGYVDGVAKSTTGSGAGTGILATQPATNYLGGYNTANREWNGAITSFELGTGCRP